MFHLDVLVFGASGQDWDNSSTGRVPSSSGGLRESPGAASKISDLHLTVTQSSFSC